MVESVDFWNFSSYIGFLGGALNESGLTIASVLGMEQYKYIRMKPMFSNSLRNLNQERLKQVKKQVKTCS